MTDREKAVVMAYTGVCMLSGEKFNIFHQYIEKKLGRPVYTHELAFEKVLDKIKQSVSEDFMAICADTFEEENMIDKSCLNYDGDEDCNKCCVYGYIFSCLVPCPDYKGFIPDRKEQEEK